MGAGTITLWVFLAILIVLVLGAWVIYNKLVRAKNEIDNAYAHIDVQLKRRYDLIPNLVETAKKYVSHERETLEAVISARNQASQARNAIHGEATAAGIGQIGALAAAEGVLGSALGRLMAVVEAYPELKADTTLRDLSEELTTTENRVGFARQAYNDSVLDYNNQAEQFPNNFIAKIFNFNRVAMLETIESPEERKAIKVQF